MTLSSAHGAHKKKAGEKRQINLALQGGGAHGAFTWGVLDRLLDEEDIDIAGISGTSAGAMNAALLIDGYKLGGRGLAKEKLTCFWKEVSDAAAALGPIAAQSPVDFSQIPGLDWLAAINPLDMLSRVFSPYELNPLNYNPLRNILEHLVKPENLTADDGIHLFVTATNVETGEARIFKGHEITVDVLLASACLPFIYQAVEIDGVPYWDGGYMGNPSIWPLVYKTACADVMLVQINPLLRSGTPKSAIDIINRVNEISFNSSLIAEMRAINFVKKLIEHGKVSVKDYTDVRMHRVMPPDGLHEMNASSKMNASWEFLTALRDIGRDQMDKWLKKHKKDLGKRATLDIEKNFLMKTPHAPAIQSPKRM